MLYVPSEQRDRAKQFDTYIGAGLTVLGNPNIAQLFSESDLTQIRSLLESAELPNIRHNRISVPLRKVLLNSPIVVPADQELFPKTRTLFSRSLVGQFPTSHVYKGDTVYSQRYGQTYKRTAARDSKAKNSSPVTEASPPENIQIMANTQFAHFPPTKWSEHWGMGRLLVTFRTELLDDRVDYIGAMALHEAIHCQDHTEHGPIESIEYRVATELRAYQVGSAIAEEYEQADDQIGIVKDVEAQRSARQTAVQQYLVDSDLIAWMAKRQLVQL